MTELDQALAVLGSLEARIMRAVWTGAVPERFTVKDMKALMPELAYTTVMTTVRRLAEKKVLGISGSPDQRAYEYTAAGTPADFLAMRGGQEVERVLEQYGDAALAAFAVRFAELTPEQRRRLEKLRGNG